MQDLLPHYERELAFLRTQADDFARRYPRIAGRLSVSGEVLQDPHVERMIQSFALLSSRIHKRLDDDFPLFTESFLGLLYPHYLRPFPSCAIASFDLGGAAAQMSKAQVLPRGTPLHTRPLRGVTCRFQTSTEVQLLPLRVSAARFQGAVMVPDGTIVPPQTTAMLSIQLELLSPQASFAGLGIDSLRFFIDGDPSLVTALREAMTGKVLATLFQTQALGPWQAARGVLPQGAGFDDAEALIDFDARSHPAYRLLTEYFAFPEKFNFVDVPLPAGVLQQAGRSLTLHFALGGLRPDSHESRMLELTSARNTVLGCAPVINLFSTRADPIRITQSQATYPVLPDGRRAFGHEVYAVDRVYRVQQTAEGEAIQVFKPFYSLQHDDLLREGEAMGRYWYTQRHPLDAGQSPGFETEIGLVDLHFNPSQPQADTLSLDVRATNRDLPSLMSIGSPGGDLFAEGGGSWREIKLLRKPSASQRFEADRGALWRLISHLSLNHLSLTAGGLDALKEMLRLYDLPRSANNERMLEGLIRVEYRAAQACLPGNPFASFVRGTEVRLTVNEQHFVGSGLTLFSQVLDRFLGLYAHINSFVQLKLISERSGEVLITCPRRTGDMPLL
ncbi:type VI secretion system baseplate subunit TssF [Ideonella azotifigens]|uniref:Type VI secretion system baseplate subunit TssF n=1 Tax=Ideonella azotifigens TaxID=513160 RepID=A0ABN1KI50_9BURK|nr:type VI secretion system baseplate subunit TssF [Ideonella azotifigens]MCD2339618.1 type VI secretion system baseplate subunit TssF [Ideonella azotifigens]